MSDVFRVQWTIVPQMAPQPWLACSRCGEARRFRSSDKIRVNVNGKRVDAWLIYKCTHCDDTWNRPVLERRPVPAIDPEFLMWLRASDPGLVHRLTFDVEGLRRLASRVEEFDDALVTRRVLSGNATSARQLEILCAVPEPVGLRVDRLLARELHLSRSCIKRLEGSGALVAFPKGARLRRALRDGMRLIITFRDAPALQMLIGMTSSAADIAEGTDAFVQVVDSAVHFRRPSYGPTAASNIPRRAAVAIRSMR